MKQLFNKLFGKPEPIPAAAPKLTLCTVSFIYDSKGFYGAGKNKRDSILAWVAEDATKEDVAQYFAPPGIDIKQCVVTEVIVHPITTINHLAK